MKDLLQRMIRNLCQFRDEVQAAVSVEFMLVLPALLAWFVGSFVFFDAFRSKTAALKATYAISDILARQTEVNNAYIDNLSDLVDALSLGTAQSWARVTSVRRTTYSHVVDWSHATDGHQGLTTGLLLERHIPEKFIPEMAIGETVLVVETHIPYDLRLPVRLGFDEWINVVVMRPRFASKVVNTDFD